MLQWIEPGSLHAECVDSIRQSHLETLTWPYLPLHDGVKSNEGADFVANNILT
uniref:Uncharacterized protein n=1 Tax=Arion vulgaris TaxID=1028688 RepID=A0A0B7AYB8_9EUPU